MTLPDWYPTHCLHCLTYRGHGESDRRPHPDDPEKASQYICPTCGYNWMVAPPEDWDGSLLIRPAREIQPPPPEYADHLDEKLIYAGSKWTREEVYG